MECMAWNYVICRRFMAMCGNAVDTASTATWSLLCRGLPSPSQPQPRQDPASASIHQLSTGQSGDRAGGYWPIRGQQTEASTQHFRSPLPASLRLRQQLGGSLTNQRRIQKCVGQWEDSVCDHVTWVEADWDGSRSDYTSYCRAQLEVTHSQQYNDMLWLISY